MESMMRALGTFCVAVALVLSTGGVAFRSLAEPVTETAATEAEPEQAQCRLREPRGAEREEFDLSELAKRERPGFVPLNGQGYNYQKPGVWYPDVPARKSAPPASPAPAP
jgi:hypothetical protein